jgi:hypothetical protein
MRILFLIGFAIVIVAAGCIVQKEPVACTMDAKICPDGSAVGRNPANNCEFYPCPSSPRDGMALNDQYTRYVSEDPEACRTVLFQCIPGSRPFTDSTGCGCRAEEPRRYVSMDPQQCETLRYTCEDHYIAFTDENGCGCEFTFEETAEGSLEAIDCTAEQRGMMCTQQYEPVCGWFGQDIQCIRYPCAMDYGNACMACADEKVVSYTGGLCPSDDRS